MQSKANNLPASTRFSLRGFDWRRYIVYVAFVAVFFYFSVTLYDEGFLSTNNLLNIARQTAMIAIMAVAMTFVIGAAQIDLSVGSVAALSALISALAMQAGLGMFGGIIAGLGTGALIGLINGLLITQIAIPAFLVTLGMMIITKGLAMWVTDTAPVPILNESFTFLFGSGDLGPIPVLLFWMVVIGIIGHVLLRKTVYGRRTLAVGGNENAAEFSGVHVKRIKLLVMVGSGMLAGLAGMLYAGRMHSARFTFGEGDELSVIAAVILGGTSLFGGTATVIGTIFGALMIGMINNGLIIMGLDVSQQMVVKGLIIILAVAFGKKAAQR
ncbi:MULTISPECIES: ABC transporter permease [Gammaproteobacteria]|uniref:Monosaccharide ABC transporter membrane protein (CUT2 family) n=1 Tax=Marinomonas foliarum TaxID=491950 RepID=A0A368ZSX2_9GAMM|nr:ABC transporter permease [Marinomonas foliarum]RCW96316.1 monosaccharide ABC transporter membrane protein (CUT2 family) [Marinomonas foliarum]